jgi:hypothetical protein
VVLVAVQKAALEAEEENLEGDLAAPTSRAIVHGETVRLVDRISVHGQSQHSSDGPILDRE